MRVAAASANAARDRQVRQLVAHIAEGFHDVSDLILEGGLGAWIVSSCLPRGV